jgi:hypothetical protein
VILLGERQELTSSLASFLSIFLAIYLLVYLLLFISCCLSLVVYLLLFISCLRQALSLDRRYQDEIAASYKSQLSY